MSVLGIGVESKRITTPHEKVHNMSNGRFRPSSTRCARTRCSHVALFGAFQVIAFLYLMTNKPSLGGALAACLIAGVISVAVARLAGTAGAPRTEVQLESSI